MINRRCMWSVFVFVICTALSFSSPYGYKAYQWEQLPVLKIGVESGLASSYDRNGGNYDYSWYDSPDGHSPQVGFCTVKTLQGPGIIYRFWMPHAMTKYPFDLRMYFDGSSTPAIEVDNETLFDRQYGYFTDPNLNFTCAGGQNLYEPIYFNDSVRIESYNQSLTTSFYYRNYYQYSYHLLPKDTEVETYTGQLTPQQQDRAEVIEMLQNAGSSPFGQDSNQHTTTLQNFSIPAQSGETIDITGPGTVREVIVKLAEPNDFNLDSINLVVTYDSFDEPAIDIPISDFFGAGHQRAAYSSLPISFDSAKGCRCFFPMPFHNSIKIEIHNNSEKNIDVEKFEVKFLAGDIPEYSCYLNCVKKTSFKQSGQQYHQMLYTEGMGHYVGDLLYVTQIHDPNDNVLRFLEGDDVITVDGKYTQYGTGLEDAYNGGAYYNWVAVRNDEPEGPYPQSATRPLSGILYVGKGWTSRADQYRWRIADCIPFTKSLEVNVECLHDYYNSSEWNSVAFWYQLPYPINDYTDLADFTQWWQQVECGECGGYDCTDDGKVDIDDLCCFASSWLGIKLQ